MASVSIPAPESPKKGAWSLILKVIIAVATALAGALGLQACNLL